MLVERCMFVMPLMLDVATHPGFPEGVRTQHEKFRLAEGPDLLAAPCGLPGLGSTRCHRERQGYGGHCIRLLAKVTTAVNFDF